MAVALTFSGMVMAETWGTATSKNNETGRVIIFRYISDFEPGFNRASEWIYYAKSEEAFFARLNQALGAQPPFPIEIHIADDPKWSNYQAFLDGLRH